MTEEARPDRLGALFHPSSVGIWFVYLTGTAITTERVMALVERVKKKYPKWLRRMLIENDSSVSDDAVRYAEQQECRFIFVPVETETLTGYEFDPQYQRARKHSTKQEPITGMPGCFAAV
jgi:hypothetical protein